MDTDALRQTMRARLPRSQAARRWYEIKNLAGPVAAIRIYEEIGFWGVTAEEFAAELDQITAPEIEVQINSPGGDVWDGIAIFNALRAHPAKITTRVDGMAASVASIIAQAGDHRVMLSGAQMVIHDAWTIAIGNAADMRAIADILDHQSDVLAGIYTERSGGDQAAIRELMRAETWLNDQATVDAGLADEVVKPQRQESDKAALTAEQILASEINLDAFAERLEALASRLEQSGAHLASVTVPAPPGLEQPDTATAESFLRAVLAPLSKETHR